MSKRWYVVHAYSGFENQVKKSLSERITRAGQHAVTVRGMRSAIECSSRAGPCGARRKEVARVIVSAISAIRQRALMRFPVCMTRLG